MTGYNRFTIFVEQQNEDIGKLVFHVKSEVFSDTEMRRFYSLFTEMLPLISLAAREQSPKLKESLAEMVERL